MNEHISFAHPYSVVVVHTLLTYQVDSSRRSLVDRGSDSSRDSWCDTSSTYRQGMRTDYGHCKSRRPLMRGGVDLESVNGGRA